MGPWVTKQHQEVISNRRDRDDVDYSNSRGLGGNILTGWVAGIKRFPRVG